MSIETHYFPHAKPSEMAGKFDGIQHPMAINSSLHHAYQCLDDVQKLLSAPAALHTSTLKNSIGAKLTTGVLLVQAALDALTVMDILRNGRTPHRSTSFVSEDQEC
jgi:hypothetical protein